MSWCATPSNAPVIEAHHQKAPQPPHTKTQQPSNGSYKQHTTATKADPVSADEYRRQHHLSVQGDTAPEPFQLFEQAPFSSDIMDEVLLVS